MKIAVFSSAGAQPISLKSFRGLGHFPNKIARMYKREHCLLGWQVPVWVLTGFACYSDWILLSYQQGAFAGAFFYISAQNAGFERLHK